jgi:excisionase family DNA binding protein
VELLTVRETAQILKVAPITVRRYIASGRLAAVKIGRGVRIRREAIEGLLTPVASVPLGEPTSEDDPLWQIVGMADSGPVQEEAPPSAPVDDAEMPGQRFLLRIAAIGDELVPEGEPSGIASAEYPYPMDDQEDDLTIPEGKPLTRNDSLFRLIGLAGSADGEKETTDVASDKYKYLAEAYTDLHQG